MSTATRNFIRTADETERGLALRIAANIDSATDADMSAAWAILYDCAHFSEALLDASRVVWQAMAVEVAAA